MWTSCTGVGFLSVLSRSPCLTAFPPPPNQWHDPQLARVGSPTCCAILTRSRPCFSRPATRGCFGVGAGGVVADQAVNARGIREIKIFVLPPVARMAAGAPAPVGDGAHSEIIDQCLFSQIGSMFPSQKTRDSAPARASEPNAVLRRPVCGGT